MSGKEQSAWLVTALAILTVLAMVYTFVKSAGIAQGFW